MDHLNKAQLTASILIIMAGCCWGIIGYFSKSLSNAGLSSIQISLLRSLVTSITLFIFTLLTDRKQLSILFKDIWLFIGSGVLSIALFNVCYFISIEENTLSLAAILLYTAPSFVVIISHLIFKEKITKNKLYALIFSFMGCFLAMGAFRESIKITLIGLFFGIGSGFGYALYSIFSGIAVKKYSSLTVIMYTFFFATIALFPFSNPSGIYSIMIHSHAIIQNTLALGWISTLLPFILYTKGLKQLEPGKASILTFIEPVIATILGITVFHEKFTVFNLGGILLILLSIIIFHNSHSNYIL